MLRKRQEKRFNGELRPHTGTTMIATKVVTVQKRLQPERLNEQSVQSVQQSGLLVETV